MAEAVAANIPNSADQNKSIREAAFASMNMTIADISGANADHVTAPSEGRVTAIHIVVSGDPGAATLITVSNLTKNVTIGTAIIANSSAAGARVSDLDIPNGAVSDKDVIKALSNAAATLAVSVNLTLEIDRAQR